MATKTKIEFTFPLITEGYGSIEFTRNKVGGFVLLMRETLQPNPRRAATQISTSTSSNTGQFLAEQFAKYWELDHNSSGLMTITAVSNVLTIEMDAEWILGGVLISIPGVTSSITIGSVSNFKLTNWSLEEDLTDPCNYYLLRLTATEPITFIQVNTNYYPAPAGTTVDVRLSRLTNIRFLSMNNIDQVYYNLMQDINYLYVGKVIKENVDIAIANNRLSGSTVNFKVNYVNQLQSSHDLALQYSLNNIDFDSSNSLTGQISGEYTVYIKDSLGCIVSIDYSVDERAGADPILYISKNNSITFSKDEVWDGQSVMKNDENTLSETSLSKINYKENLLFQTQDNTTIQVKSNFQTIRAFIEDGCDSVLEVPVVKMSNNINRFLGIDGFIYNYKQGYSGLYFVSGNTYLDDGSIDSQFVLNGNLPDFAIIGQFVEVFDGGGSVGFFEIEDVVYDPNVNKRAIIFRHSFTGNPSAVRVESHYDLLNIEVYHFNVDFSIVEEENCRIYVKGEDTVFPEERQYSENIYVKDLHERTVAIEYFGDDNRDIFYAYGIKHFIRLEFSDITALIDDKISISKGDNTSSVNASDLYDGNKFEFEGLTRDNFLKACIAVSSPYIKINNIGYIKKESLNYENIKGTNLYNLSVDMLKTNNKINGKMQVQSGFAPTIYIPGVLTGDLGFFKL